MGVLPGYHKAGGSGAGGNSKGWRPVLVVIFGRVQGIDIVTPLASRGEKNYIYLNILISQEVVDGWQVTYNVVLKL